MGAPTDCLPYDIEEPIRSESVVLGSFDPSDASGFFVRLCRYPTVGVAWLWVSAFPPDDGEAATYNIDHLPCGYTTVDPDLGDASYALPGGTVLMERHGDREDPSRVHVAVRVDGHRGTNSPDEGGGVPITVEASFERYGAGGPTLRGRSELHGRVTGVFSIGDRRFEVDAPGQWHEQLQDAPRFRAPFTYAALISPETSLVALSSGALARGWLREGGRVAQLQSVDITRSPGAATISIETQEGEARSFAARVTRELTIPLYGLPWRGTRVVAGGGLAGMVNTFDPHP